MASRNGTRLVRRLQSVFERHQDELPEYGWASEGDRWAELVFCLLCQVRNEEPEATRAAVDLLNLLGLLDVPVLARMEGEDAAILKRVLRSHGFTAADAARGEALLRAIAQRTTRRFQGKVQRVLRKHGERMRQEFTRAFAGAGLSETALEYALSQWLQNALSLPISLENDAVRAFCKAQRVRLADLVECADALDINMALVDDLIALDQAGAS